MRRTIQKIIFRRDSLEVIVALEDRTKLNIDQGLANRLGRSAQNAREGAVNPVAPACSTSSILKLADSTSSVQTESNSFKTFSAILPHNLLDRRHMPEGFRTS